MHGANPKRLSGILHGRRQGRRLRDAQTSVMDRLLPVYRLDLGQPLDPRLLFPGPISELRLEIGFGGGEHLAAQAAANPEIGFIGCEPFRNGIASLMQHLDARAAPNLRVHDDDAGEVVDRLGAGTIARVDLLYPDPWPKRRQRKRRFVSSAMLGRLARILRPGGSFRFATDIDDYAGWTLARVMQDSAFEWEAGEARDWLEPWPDWVRTRYEAKAVQQGRRPVYLTFGRR
jgi:tRNA (guanine-N7-)-methyltransferase